MMSDYDVIVIGAGASGLMCGIAAGRAGARVALLERNDKPGRKLYITGKGRCNVTNDSGVDELMKNTPRNPRFMYAAYSALSSSALMELIEAEGVPLKTERGRRVFPVSDHASDITRALESAYLKCGGKLLTLCRVVSAYKKGSLFTVRCEGGREITSRALVIATGGSSYPLTGSTGDGYRLAQSFGHSIKPLSPSLVGIETAGSFCGSLQGISLKNVRLRLTCGKRKYMDEVGELMLAHYGLSGPLALSASACISGSDPTQWDISLDLKCGYSAEELDAKLVKLFAQYANRDVSNALRELLISKLPGEVLSLCDVEPATPCNAITKQQRQRIGECMKDIRLKSTGLRGMDEAVITRGGVDVKEIDPSTMQSKLTAGLFFAGEVVDVDSLTGGFNLQCAFSTGYLAGRSAAQAGGLL